MIRTKSRRELKYPNTDTFKFFNANPMNRITSDCVIRAIAIATEQSWVKVTKDLANLACETGYDPQCKQNFATYLRLHDFVMNPQPHHTDNTKYTIKEFLAEHPKGIFVIGIAGHLTTAVDGKILDTWDCSKSIYRVGNYWSKLGH